MREKVHEKGVKFILNEIPQLREKGMISNEVGENLIDYYQSKLNNHLDIRSKLLTIIFLSIAALLIGTGCIMLIAHNWDKYGNLARLLIAFVPLIISSTLMIISYNKSSAWRESASIFHACATGSAIAIISQIYNLGGNLKDYLYILFLILTPLVFIMRSHMLKIIYAAVYFSFMTSAFRYNTGIANYLIFLPASILLWQIIRKPKSQISAIFSFCLLILLGQYLIKGSFFFKDSSLMYGIFFAINGGILALGCQFDKTAANFKHLFLAISYSAMAIMLCFMMSPENHSILQDNFVPDNLLQSIPVLIVSLLGVIYMIYVAFKRQEIGFITPIIFILLSLFLCDANDTLEVTLRVIITLLAITIAIYEIIKGVEKESIISIEGGVLFVIGIIITFLASSDLSIIGRAISFITIGIIFAVSNIFIIKKFKKAKEL